MPGREFGDAPPQPQQDYINLPTLINDELGISTSVARMEIALGTVYIDEVKSEEKFDFKRSEVAGKFIKVLGARRNFRLFIPAE